MRAELLSSAPRNGRLIADARGISRSRISKGRSRSLLQVLERDPPNPEAQQLLDEVRVALTRREKEREYRGEDSAGTGTAAGESFDEAAALLRTSIRNSKLARRSKSRRSDPLEQRKFRAAAAAEREIAAVEELLPAAQFEAAIKRVEALMKRFPEEVEPTRLFISRAQRTGCLPQDAGARKARQRIEPADESGHFERALSLVTQSLNTYPASRGCSMPSGSIEGRMGPSQARTLFADCSRVRTWLRA